VRLWPPGMDVCACLTLWQGLGDVACYCWLLVMTLQSWVRNQPSTHCCSCSFCNNPLLLLVTMLSLCHFPTGPG
jgi:hypothetical protein